MNRERLQAINKLVTSIDYCKGIISNLEEDFRELKMDSNSNNLNYVNKFHSLGFARIFYKTYITKLNELTAKFNRS